MDGTMVVGWTIAVADWAQIAGTAAASGARVGFTTAYNGNVASGVNNLGITTSSIVDTDGVLLAQTVLFPLICVGPK